MLSGAMRRFLVLAVLLAALCPVPAALADGDPASDYLIAKQSFVPLSGTSGDKADELESLLVSAKRKGFRLKVAVISSKYDMGSIPVLFRSPTKYANFLGQEDFPFWKDELLVVMPNGYGLYKAKTGVPAADEKAIAKLPHPNTTKPDELVNASVRAVQALASRRGLTLVAVDTGGGGSGANRDRVVIAVAVLAVAALGLLARFLLRRRGRHAVA